MPAETISDTLQLLRRYHMERIPTIPSNIQIRDEDDRWVLASAINAKAEVLITGDKDLLDIASKVKKLRIITPRGFWELVQKKLSQALTAF